MPRKTDKVGSPDTGRGKKVGRIRRTLRNLGLIGEGPKGGLVRENEKANDAGKFSKRG
jgi:hypothetical protein